MTSEIEVVDAGPLRYLVSRPPTSDPAPLLCFLHGYDEAAPLAIERALRLHGPLAPHAAPAARERFLVVAPQLPRAGDLWHRHVEQVEAIVDALGTSVDSTRRYLTGFSFGGNGVFDLALASPGRWAALWPVDPTRVPPRDPGAPIWLSVGAAARPQARAFARALGTAPPG
ncbi:MAG TPA: hypothetical protein VEA99_14150, partial [Gemmatimonadaceae bacterium]|nr:hypothetical protein [Gemmatimonadaceae bacterium]